METTPAPAAETVGDAPASSEPVAAPTEVQGDAPAPPAATDGDAPPAKRRRFDLHGVRVKHVPSNATHARVKAKLAELGITPSKIFPRSEINTLELFFADESATAEACARLDRHTWGKVMVRASVMNETALQKSGRAMERKNKTWKRTRGKSDNPMDAAAREAKKKKAQEEALAQRPQSAEDAATPLHATDYPRQLVLKRRGVIRVLQKTTKQLLADQRKRLKQCGRDARLRKEIEESYAWVPRAKGQTVCPMDLEVVPSPVIDGYRNKVELSIAWNKSGEQSVGFVLHKGEGDHEYNDVVDEVWNCKNVTSEAKDVARIMEDVVRSSSYDAYHRGNKAGVWRSLCVRTMADTREQMVMVQIRTADLSEEQLTALKRELCERFTAPLVTSLYLQVYNGVSTPTYEEAAVSYEHLAGAESITETLLGMQFRISPTSFFQTNTKATESLYRLLTDWALDEDAVYKSTSSEMTASPAPPVKPEGEAEAPKPRRTTVFDVCCGTGTIGIAMAKLGVDKVVGVESVPDAVLDARRNAEVNGVADKCSFVAGKAEDVLAGLLEEHSAEDERVIAIVDPPRGGLHMRTLRALRACTQLKRFVYVMCNPAALVNQASILSQAPSNQTKGMPFVPRRAAVVDLFPHTKHAELVVLFERMVRAVVKK